MNKNSVIEKIKSCLLNNEEIEFAYLYGSFAINKESPLSDIDIAVYQKQNSSKDGVFDKRAYDLRMTELKIESELSRLLPEIEFDVRSFNDAPIVVTGKILNEGRLLFFKDENFYYDYIVNMRLRYMDYSIVYNPLFNKRYESLLNG